MLKPRNIFGIVILISFISGVAPVCPAQDTQARYQRKSISYVDAILPLGSNVRLSGEQEQYLLRVIKNEIEMSRFDYNSLPENLLTAFKREIKTRSVHSIDQLAETMNHVLVPEIMRIVDVAKEMRAQGLVSEAEQHSFVVEKAKETGITVEDLEAVMNSAYIYIPVISKAVLKQDADNNTAAATLEGGIIWYSINTDNITTSVKLLVKKEAEGMGYAKLDGNFSHEGRQLNGTQYAFFTAAKTLAKNLKIATQEIPEFQLTNPLANTGVGWVEFALGEKEDICVDDKFIIAEYYEAADGSLTQKKLGMVRVSKVADNRNKPTDSRARVVIGGGYERGMMALEHPRLPIDLSFRFGVLPIGIDLPEESGGDELTGTVYGGQLFFNYNLAQATEVSQLFFSLYGEVGVGSIEDWYLYDEKTSGGLYFGAGAGLVKKFYVNRLHLGLEAFGSWGMFSISDNIPEAHASLEDTYEWNINSIGLILNGNLEIALGYDLNLGGGISYRLFAPTDEWTVKLDEEDHDSGEDETLPEFNFGGLGFQVFLTWSLPSLGYDPLAAARGVIGQ